MAWRVIGQTKAVSLLQRGLETNSLAHAYLFTGPPHVGKMTLAINLAQALNCDAAGPPCGECPSCQKIASSKHADVQVMVMNGEASEDNRAKISVSQIEDLQHSVNLPPFEGKCKVFIIDGAELLSTGAANRLLKTLEEPVGKVVFILLTVDDNLLLPTVVSRCQRVDLSLVPAGQIEAALVTKWALPVEDSKLLSRLCHGALGWAVSAAGDDNVLAQRDEWLDTLLDAIDSGAEERFAYAGQLASQFTQNRASVYRRLDLWLDWWRDLLIVKAGSAEAVTNVDRIETLSEMAQGLSLAQVRSFVQSIRSTAEALRLNASPKLAIEVMMLDIPEAANSGQVWVGA